VVFCFQTFLHWARLDHTLHTHMMIIWNYLQVSNGISPKLCDLLM
jgi:hypothetical protein